MDFLDFICIFYGGMQRMYYTTKHRLAWRCTSVLAILIILGYNWYVLSMPIPPVFLISTRGLYGRDCWLISIPPCDEDSLWPLFIRGVSTSQTRYHSWAHAGSIGGSASMYQINYVSIIVTMKYDNYIFSYIFNYIYTYIYISLISHIFLALSCHHMMSLFLVYPKSCWLTKNHESRKWESPWTRSFKNMWHVSCRFSRITKPNIHCLLWIPLHHIISYEYIYEY